MLYRIFVTASSALNDLGISVAGNGGGLVRCDDLYVSAEVESSICGGGLGTLSVSLRDVVENEAIEKPLDARAARNS